ncbi:MAG: MarR family transcriptional regulator [Actinobacteria bacterium 13_2_20CM_2_71_6]|nr:MAG: MarR family transcriptional regulator [Actinobacteria bacterium 13_2_20CM_2_71_6]
MTGQHTIAQTEQAVAELLGGLPLDFDAMMAVSNIYRASTAIRHHLEDLVLRTVDLTWTGFVVLWVLWVWGELEARHAAAEAGITKGTLTGVIKTLGARRLVERRGDPDDGRVVRLRLTPAGKRLMRKLFPEFNREEAFVVAALRAPERRRLARSLRDIVQHVEEHAEERRAALRQNTPGVRRSGGRVRAPDRLRQER